MFVYSEKFISDYPLRSRIFYFIERIEFGFLSEDVSVGFDSELGFVVSSRSDLI